MPSGDGGHDLATDSSTLVNEDAHWRIVRVSTGEQGHHLVPDEPMPAGSGQGGHLASNRRFHSGERGPQHKDERCMSLMARAVQKHSRHGSTGTHGVRTQHENLISRMKSMAYAKFPIRLRHGQRGTPSRTMILIVVRSTLGVTGTVKG